MSYVVVKEPKPARDTARGRTRPAAARRFEIRESRQTPAGPRARTLATFRVLTDDVLARAAARAERPFDATAVAERAEALGAPRATGTGARAARDLLVSLRAGHRPGPALTALLRAELRGPSVAAPDSVEPVLEWAGASDDERGRALRDLLRLADRIPTRRRPAGLHFPGIAGPP
jgi:hypothetical protein